MTELRASFNNFVMKTKYQFLPYAAFLCLGSLWASPLASIGETTDVYFNFGALVRGDSNVTAAASGAQEDLIVSLRPGFEVDFFRGESRVDAVLFADLEILRYVENDIYNVENLGVSGTFSITDAVYQLGGRFFYQESQTTTQQVDLDGLIENEAFGLSGFVRYEMTAKVATRVGLEYLKQDYVGRFGPLLQDRETYTVPVRFFYEYSPKLDLTLGIRYRKVDIRDLGASIGNDPEDWEFTVGVEGELLPKLVGSVDVGYQRRRFTRGNLSDRSTATFGAELQYDYSPKLYFNLSADRDFESAADGNPNEKTEVTFSGTYSYNSFVSASGFVTGRADRYKLSGREDDSFTLGVAGSYVLNSFWVLGGRLYYTTMNSNEDRDFNKGVAEISANFRY